MFKSLFVEAKSFSVYQSLLQSRFFYLNIQSSGLETRATIPNRILGFLFCFICSFFFVCVCVFVSFLVCFGFWDRRPIGSIFPITLCFICYTDLELCKTYIWIILTIIHNKKNKPLTHKHRKQNLSILYKLTKNEVKDLN